MNLQRKKESRRSNLCKPGGTHLINDAGESDGGASVNMVLAVTWDVCFRRHHFQVDEEGDDTRPCRHLALVCPRVLHLHVFDIKRPVLRASHVQHGEAVVVSEKHVS